MHGATFALLGPFGISKRVCVGASETMFAGVFNVVSGDAKAIGEAMLVSPSVRKIGFTGSTKVGKYLMERSAATVKRVSMELGGNAPFIVFEDADLEAAAKAVLASGLRNAGQTCICANRVLVQVRSSCVGLPIPSRRAHGAAANVHCTHFTHRESGCT